ncbi:hypothetical protein K525DRAFT_362242 [Schizophyllum commune Loenen D]|nr:hypothetical protein K525DRAFT_362242 [Schizophyllum commune Loenen D]
MSIKVGRALDISPTLETALTAAVTLRTLSAALDLAFCPAKLWHAAAMRKLGFTKFTSLMSSPAIERSQREAQGPCEQ